MPPWPPNLGRSGGVDVHDAAGEIGRDLPEGEEAGP